MATQRTGSASPVRAQGARRQPLIDFTQLVGSEVIAVSGGAVKSAVIAIAALTSIAFRGLIDQSGHPSGQIGVGYGWSAGLVGGLLILVGSICRPRESGPRRKPPGVL